MYYFQASKNNTKFDITAKELKEAGYSVIPISPCAATIVFKQIRTNSTCGISSKAERISGFGV
jgi:predicted CoA-binding protein